ncbi:MAG: glycoside hydrolase [Acidobacteria bacterium OLB17]|nr:MAG: glycoside hydrolase [Acidobacteria bacterium OLB17]MCZ2389701.1 glycoside hydrolase family 3 protein [Acidobacteriota bacterium]
MMKSIISLILVFTFLAGGSTLAKTGGRTAGDVRPFAPSEKDWKRADKLLKKMSLEEKVGQLIQIGINARFANRDSAYFKELKRQVVENKIGGVIFFGAPMYETSVLINRMQAEAKLPLLMALDAETGVGMRFADAVNFPWAMAVAATGEPDYARRIGVITAREARAMGFQHIYAPVLDVNNNATNPVINVRSFGEDPQDVARFGTAFIDGVQSERAIATAKHFPGHGDTAVDSHRGLPIIDHSLASLEKTELVPFRAAVKDGVASVMIAHIALPQIDNEAIMPLKNYRGGDAEAGAEIVDQKAYIPATLSKKVQTDLLRNEMGFKGLIVTDAMSMSGLTLYFEQGEAGVRAFLAGSDLLEKPSDPDAMLAGIIAAAKSGRIPPERLDDSVRRILAWKSAVGLFEKRFVNIDAMDTIISGPESLALASEVASKAITLVRNNASALPVDRSKKIVVLGLSNGFDGPETMASFAATLRSQGLKFKSHYLQENSLNEDVQAARSSASDADIVIVGLFGRVRSGAKNSVGVPENGAAILRSVLAEGKQVIGISFGNPYVLGSFPEMQAYVVAYGDMSSLQRAAARSILGLQPITGRLPITLPGLYPKGTGIQVTAK